NEVISENKKSLTNELTKKIYAYDIRILTAFLVATLGILLNFNNVSFLSKFNSTFLIHILFQIYM
ncbi:MAG: hypothetical protein Q8835_03585, partial [Sweet potato little leaf phytoplasma]|nr:hypothetical protein [Sweet potato little leaf phytoplasma]